MSPNWQPKRCQCGQNLYSLESKIRHRDECTWKPERKELTREERLRAAAAEGVDSPLFRRS